MLLREIKSLKKVTLNLKKIDIDPKLDFEGKLKVISLLVIL